MNSRITSKTKRDKALLAEMLGLNAQASEPCLDGFHSLLKRYQDRMLLRGRAKGTIRNHLSVLVPLCDYLTKRDITPAEIPPTVVIAFLQKYFPKNDSCRRAVVFIRVFLYDLLRFESCRVEKVITILPKTPPPRSIPNRVMSISEVTLLLRAKHRSKETDIRNSMMIDLMYSGALRPKEVRLLKLEDWDSKNREVRIRVAKSKQGEKVIVSSRTARLLDLYSANHRQLLGAGAKSKWMFPTTKGKALTHPMLWRVVQNVSKAALLDKSIRPYDLRHAAATHMLEAGATVIEVGRYLRHKNLCSTSVYTHVSYEYMKKQHREFHLRGKKPR